MKLDIARTISDRVTQTLGSHDQLNRTGDQVYWLVFGGVCSECNAVCPSQAFNRALDRLTANTGDLRGLSLGDSVRTGSRSDIDVASVRDVLWRLEGQLSPSVIALGLSYADACRVHAIYRVELLDESSIDVWRLPISRLIDQLSE